MPPYAHEVPDFLFGIGEEYSQALLFRYDGSSGVTRGCSSEDGRGA